MSRRLLLGYLLILFLINLIHLVYKLQNTGVEILQDVSKLVIILQTRLDLQNILNLFPKCQLLVNNVPKMLYYSFELI